MKSIIVNVVPEETKTAVVEQGELLEIAIERQSSAHLVGNIYKGRIQNVLPGMQAAFVDIGQEKNAFLYIGDGMPKHAVQSLENSEQFCVGQNVVIQIVKDAIGTKGPRATTHITLPGRSIVLMPTVGYIGISRRIECPEERQRLKTVAEKICPPEMGVIIRTVAQGQSEAALKKDIDYLIKLWRSLKSRNKVAHTPTLLYRDADLMIRIVRDYFTGEFDRLVIDQQEAYTRICDLLRYISPELESRVVLYQGKTDVFTAYGLADELEKLGKREVELKSGGSIVIDKTEALTVIDVNTGKFVGQTNLSDTVFQTNLEAASEITKQLRLRDIGGIIIVDFIDMDRPEQKQEVLKFLEQQVKADKTKTNIVGITQLGLVEITRKKSRQNFEGIIYSTCPCCEGRGVVEAAETVRIRIVRQLRLLESKQHAANGYIIQVHQMVADHSSQWVNSLERELSCKIKLDRVQNIHPEVYSVLTAGSGDV